MAEPELIKDRREKLQTLLESICDNVYFQPPPSTKMHYPCIRFTRSNASSRFGDNRRYTTQMVYTLIVISKDPDSPIIDALLTFKNCIHDRHYFADNLNHDVFTLYW